MPRVVLGGTHIANQPLALSKRGPSCFWQAVPIASRAFRVGISSQSEGFLLGTHAGVGL